MWVIKHPKDKLVFVSSRSSSTVCKMCLHRQKGVLITIAYRRLAFLSVNSLRRAWGQKFVTTTFAKNLCIRAKAPILIWEWVLSSPYCWAPKKSRRQSMLGASTLSGKGTLGIGSTGTPITALISCGSIWMVCPLTKVCMIRPLSASWVTIIWQ
jgi:hypothetical protein